jgi:flagellin
MRGQIRGLNQAIRNAQDGISLIQTAEGALQEVHAILQRINELAIQAANGTYTDEDRQHIQKEVVALKKEIENIVNNTEFNRIKLINGASSKDLLLSGKYIVTWIFDTLPNDGDIIGIADLTTMFFADFQFVNPNNMDNTWIDIPIKSDLYSTLQTLKETFDLLKAKMIRFPSEQQAVQNTEMYINGNTVIIITDKPISVTSSVGIDADLITGDPAFITISGNGGIAIQTGANTNDTFLLDMPNLTILSFSVNSIDLTTQSGASNAIDKIQAAINFVSESRSKLGSYQNRLEHTMNNIANYAENLTAAESRIRDADIAKEVMEFTKMNILQQSAQAILAQANQTPQGILQMLNHF